MVETVGRGGAGGRVTPPILGGSRRKIRQRIKELEGKKVERQMARHEKNLKMEVSREPTITRVEAKAVEKARNEYIKQGTDAIKKAHAEVLAKFHKDFPRPIGGMGTSTGHGKGLGAKFERMFLTKESRQKERQYKRENKQVAKQRRLAGEPERREVKRPKSGLYKDTSKPKPKTTSKPKPPTMSKQAIPPTKTQANGGPKRPDSEKFNY